LWEANGDGEAAVDEDEAAEDEETAFLFLREEGRKEEDAADEGDAPLPSGDSSWDRGKPVADTRRRLSAERASCPGRAAADEGLRERGDGDEEDDEAAAGEERGGGEAEAGDGEVSTAGDSRSRARDAAGEAWVNAATKDSEETCGLIAWDEAGGGDEEDEEEEEAGSGWAAAGLGGGGGGGGRSCRLMRAVSDLKRAEEKGKMPGSRGMW
jgi:hypothetical protein